MPDLPLRLAYVPLAEIRPAPSNPRAHDTDTIKESIRKFGFVDPLNEDARTGRLLGGHGRIEALVELQAEGARCPDGIVVDDDGGWLVPVIRGVYTASNVHASALLVSLNKATENARWNDYGLAELVENVVTEAPDLLDATGFNPDKLDDLIRQINPERLGDQDPDAPRRPDRPAATVEADTLGGTPLPAEPDPDRITATGASTGPRGMSTQCPGCGLKFTQGGLL